MRERGRSCAEDPFHKDQGQISLQKAAILMCWHSQELGKGASFLLLLIQSQAFVPPVLFTTWGSYEVGLPLICPLPVELWQCILMHAHTIAYGSARDLWRGSIRPLTWINSPGFAIDFSSDLGRVVEASWSSVPHDGIISLVLWLKTVGH